ncbi:hypothetical protein BDV18DRAFT_149428 [Aspergillus unguis]
MLPSDTSAVCSDAVMTFAILLFLFCSLSRVPSISIFTSDYSYTISFCIDIRTRTCYTLHTIDSILTVTPL